MNTRPIVTAPLSFNDDGIPYSSAYQDIYHPLAGAFTQARHVFLGGNALPQRWQKPTHQRDHFVILETGFGLGNNFLATWQAWREDPARCDRLVFISIEQSPLSADDMRLAHAHSPAAALASELIAAWPPLTHNLHCLDFEQGQVQLLLALGDVSTWLPELEARVDAFYVDGFALARNPLMWQPRIFKAFARLAAPDATLATWTAAHTVREGLRAAGFAVRETQEAQEAQEAKEAQGGAGKRDITLARYAPAFAPRHAPSRITHVAKQKRAVIVGAGLAGCSTAWALAEQGWHCTVLDRQAEPAQETSGNPAGLFHGIVNAHDGTHARFNRAAALHAQHLAGVTAQGLLRLDSADTAAMRATLNKLGLPADYVRAVDAAQASALSGLALQQSAWFYPGGGWARPAALARDWLAQASPQADFRGSVKVDRLHRAGDAWQLLDAHGRVIDQAEVVVLANAGDALRLLGQPAWPIEAVRGQVSFLDHSHAPSLTLPRLPVAGSGYLLPDIDGCALFGATSQPRDMDAAVRSDDHTANLAQLSHLLGEPVDVPSSALQGRTGWRWVAQDKLPVIGAVPDATASSGRPLDQPRFVPRVKGLYVFTALGSRGITWSALGARTLASLITGAPSPLEASLLDAIDPARFVSRAVRSQASRESGHTPADD
ncbi:MAG: bifunctional tRNA (5-methylaminomethyl-2-thiouridine)(34)-methyltransferase MnmD/FAD-dependent 5-carboxymethylaminomethyl-2-thiouridine(34) oxidoreductase MnmC [Cytophagales bacterium]|nr:bifunctional tRNA (5-methylaminomethyl-2-thiouridine)(34)-methyltransferase MnmD/FAD-dependent 5-carboxymethylaminomethyl-2-thiouridine(34) oxidoreductase MnmC [Rhizobacter sp.]